MRLHEQLALGDEIAIPHDVARRDKRNGRQQRQCPTHNALAPHPTLTNMQYTRSGTEGPGLGVEGLQRELASRSSPITHETRIW